LLLLLPELVTSRPTRKPAALTFKKVFADKTSELAEKLDVTNELLRKLQDAKIIDPASFRRIKDIKDNSDKVDDLLNVIVRRDDSLLPDFCRILRVVDQLHVVKLILPDGHYLRHELIPDELDAELKQTVEPRYGLPGYLYYKEVINYNQRQIVDEASSVTDRVFRLLQAVRENFRMVKVELFLQALEVHDQPHVANYIKTNGKIGIEFGDVRPLSDQQRRNLWSTQGAFVTLDLQEGRFLDLLEHRAVISHVQLRDVDKKSKQSHSESVQLLLGILERRSLANFKQFIECLRETEQSSVIQCLNEGGAVARLRSTIDEPEFSMRNETDVETTFVKVFNDLICQKSNDLAFILLELMKKAGCKVTHAKRESSIAWYIVCRTEEKLESLRRLYKSPSRLLERILQCIFNHVCGSGDNQRLCVTWATEDYDNCKRYLAETSGRPFELSQCHDEPPASPGFIVSIAIGEYDLEFQFHYICVSKRMTQVRRKLIFNRSEISTFLNLQNLFCCQE
jgi:hypothetical protein